MQGSTDALSLFLLFDSERWCRASSLLVHALLFLGLFLQLACSSKPSCCHVSHCGYLCVQAWLQQAVGACTVAACKADTCSMWTAVLIPLAPFALRAMTCTCVGSITFSACFSPRIPCELFPKQQESLTLHSRWTCLQERLFDKRRLYCHARGHWQVAGACLPMSKHLPLKLAWGQGFIPCPCVLRSSTGCPVGAPDCAPAWGLVPVLESVVFCCHGQAQEQAGALCSDPYSHELQVGPLLQCRPLRTGAPLQLLCGAPPRMTCDWHPKQWWREGAGPGRWRMRAWSRGCARRCKHTWLDVRQTMRRACIYAQSLPLHPPCPPVCTWFSFCPGPAFAWRTLYVQCTWRAHRIRKAFAEQRDHDANLQCIRRRPVSQIQQWLQVRSSNG